jgi:hypothetical protein
MPSTKVTLLGIKQRAEDRAREVRPALGRRGRDPKVAYVKPVAQPRADGGPDCSVALVTAIQARSA